MRLYLDEDSQSRAIYQALRNAGHDVLTTAEARRMRSPDEEQLAFATSQERVVLTANRQDYARLHRDWMGQSRSQGGILLRSQRIEIGQLVRLIGAVDQAFGKDMRDRAEWLSSWKSNAP